MRAACFSIFSLIWAQYIFAQSLSVGDSVPDIRFQQTISYASKSARLSDFGDKLVIIDFWATWCASCIHGFPKLDSLQHKLGNNLQIVLVNTKDTRDDSSSISNFFKKWEASTGKNLDLLTVIDDTIASKLFEHNLIPHYVWINKQRRVIAISSSDAVTEKNIDAALHGVPLDFTMKKDQDMQRLLFANKDLPMDSLLNYSILVKGWFDGLPSGNRFHEKNDVRFGMEITNTCMLDMYRIIARSIDRSMNKKTIVIEIKDSSDFSPPVNRDKREIWYKQHAYSFDVIVPAGHARQLYKKMLESLNNYTGYNGQFETRKIKCWRLVKINSFSKQIKISSSQETENKLWNPEQPYLRNGTINMLVERLNNISFIKNLVIDITDYHGKLNIEFPGGLTDFASIQRQLSQFGLSLVAGESTQKLFIIKKK